ncbi:TerD family protein [Streptomyces hainanensis]|uniref:TerD family protein n=1 Tax=Streptomyces hainanensis TaxID=402648 RepID=A0A4R4SUE6_9ACTN|nr:TerD family protein [Streptomyces hainanensis]TDC67741.1 TerD family protein [Streptomyces hainanensis]
MANGGVSLGKGANVSLTKRAPALTAVRAGLGMGAPPGVSRGRARVAGTGGADVDPDASALPTDARGRVLSDDHFVFFNNLKSPDGTVEHLGDELVGSTDSATGGDEEEINVDLAAMAPEVDRIVFPVSIYEAEARRQNFGLVSDAYIRIINQADGRELARYDLTEDASTETAMVFGEPYRRVGEWKFRAIGQGYASGLRGIALDHGVNV